MEKTKWQKFLMKEWEKEKKKKSPCSFREIMSKAKKSYKK
jgi:hypothetical protein